MTNFKQETMELIGDHKVDEYYLEYIGCRSVSEWWAWRSKPSLEKERKTK